MNKEKTSKKQRILTVLLTIAIALLIILLRGLNETKSADITMERYSTQFMDVFDTVSTVIIYDEDEASFQEKANTVHETLMNYHQLFDIYNDYDGVNNIKTINDHAGENPVKVDEKLIELIEFGKEMYSLTNGKVNIAEGAVLRLWHDYREAGILNPEQAKLPLKEDLKEASQHTNIEDIIIDKEASTVFLTDPEMSLDVGGIAKGFAVEKAGTALKEMGTTNALLNIGGNLKAIGNRGDGTDWVCPVENPEYRDSQQGERYAITTGLNDYSLVTSGDYERYYMVDGERYHHIIDPDTLYPGRSYRSVTILMKDSGTADALSTGLFLMTIDEGKELISSWNESHDAENQVQVMWIEQGGEKTFTDGFKDHVIQN